MIYLSTDKVYDVKLEDPTRKAPTSYKSASNREFQWFSAEDKEQDGILHFQTWQRLPQTSITIEMRKKALHIHLLYDVKRDGSAKTRAVANGSRQHTHTYTNTTSPVASQLQVRIHLVHIALREYQSIQMDLTNAYLHADIADFVLIIIPEGYPGAKEISLLKKGLYGTKQGSRRFYDHTDKVLHLLGFVSQDKIKDQARENTNLINNKGLRKNIIEKATTTMLRTKDTSLMTVDRK